ncbi:LptM family lipoprotein [Nonomuraea sp. H19]|uniref:LptM family lipoprotein n=1 Tax=Nonomuraea sp. H19 TaxID=3452206 RepID=UPI003F8A0B48
MEKTRALIALMVAIFMLSGCGQPEFTYVRDKAGTTYFKVPSSFTQLNASPIELYLTGDHPNSQAATLRAERVWSTAFDQSAEPSVNHLLGSQDPFVYATVHQLTEEQRDGISLNRLRDFILPVTGQVRQLYLQQSTVTGQPPMFTNFELLGDEVLTLDNGARGVRVRFNYQIGNNVQTFDHTAVLDEKGGTVSVLLIGCQSICFRKRAAEFDKIANSFKLLRLPG